MPDRIAQLSEPFERGFFDDGFVDAYSFGKVSRRVLWILSRHSSESFASAAKSGQRFIRHLGIDFHTRLKWRIIAKNQFKPPNMALYWNPY